MTCKYLIYLQKLLQLTAPPTSALTTTITTTTTTGLFESRASYLNSTQNWQVLATQATFVLASLLPLLLLYRKKIDLTTQSGEV